LNSNALNHKPGEKNQMRTLYFIMISILIATLSACQRDVGELDKAGIGEIEASKLDTGHSQEEVDSGSDPRDSDLPISPSITILETVEYDIQQRLKLVNSGPGSPSKQNLWVALISDDHPYQEVIERVISPGEYDPALSLVIDPEAAGDVVLHLAVSGTRLHFAVDDYLDTSNTDRDRVRVYFDRELDGLWPTVPAEDGCYDLSARDGGRLSFYPVYNPGSGAVRDYRNRERDPPGFAAVAGFVDGHRVYELSLDLEITHLDVGPAGAFGMYMYVSNSENYGDGTETGAWPPVIPEVDDQMYFGRVDMTPQEAWLHASPGELYFEGIEERTAPNPAILAVSELLGGAVSFTASSSASWLQVTPASGQTPLDLMVAVDQTGLAVGTYQGEITLESGETGNSQHVVPVTFGVLPKPARLSVSPLTLQVTVVEGDPDPNALFTVENLGGVEMDVLLTPSEAWISTTGGFIVQPGASQNVPVQISLAGMAVGTYTAGIVVDAPGAEDTPAMVTVQLEIQSPNSAPPAPLLMSPANGSELYGAIDLMAYPVTDPDGDPVTYQFELTVSATGDQVDSGAGVEDSGFVYWQPTAQLEENVLYRWRVKAADDKGAESDYSEAWTFLTIKKPSSDDCGCAHSQTPSVGFLFFLLGLLVMRLSGRRG